MKDYKKFFYVFSIALFFIFSIVLSVNYIQMEKIKKDILKTQVENVIYILNSFRKVYQEKFIEYHIPINQKTIHLIPVAILPQIAKVFSNKINGSIEIKLISDNPRNPKNIATSQDEKILKKLRISHKDMITISSGKTEIIKYYKPLYITPMCLKCHNTQQTAPRYIREHYNNSYGYKIGDLKGAIVVEIKDSNFVKLLKSNFTIRVLSALILYIIILIVVFFLLKKLEEKDMKYIRRLTIANKELEIAKQKAENAGKAKGEFLANMSHEIRTPLNAMFGFINLLKDKNCDKESKKYLNIIEKSGQTLLSVINDILDFSKIESGKLNIEKISFDLEEEIEIIYKLFENKAKEKKVNLYIHKTGTECYIISDPIRLKQVISNLLSNAIKFTDSGKNIYLNINYSNEKLSVDVIDKGIGINKDKLEHIFKAFSQADTSTTRKYGGTGLGLTISYKLVELLGGRLEVKSEENKGSKFYFTIPAKKGEKIVEKEEKNKDIKKFNYHLLLVEDNKANQMFMKIILQKLGISFDIANDGLEAVELYKKNYNKYDLILMDENMPNMTGSEATIEIRKFEKENNLKRVFIVAISANAFEEDQKKFIEIGMDKFLAKPLEISKLKEILGNLK